MACPNSVGEGSETFHPFLPSQAGPLGSQAAGRSRLQLRGAPSLGRPQRRVHRQGDRREHAGYRGPDQEQPGQQQVRGGG